MRVFAITVGLLNLFLASVLLADEGPNPLEQDLGRNDLRVFSAATFIQVGQSLESIGLVQRLERLGYLRISDRPQRPGEFFFGEDRFWIYRRAHRLAGRDYAASLLGLTLADGRVIGGADVDGDMRPLRESDRIWIEPELLAESITQRRAVRIRADIEDLQTHTWKALLAIEDARFLGHPGIDPRALARATLANLRDGSVSQGGSTLTQQLIKNRDMRPRRTIGRKLSEAARAVWIESRYGKRQVLEAYLNRVYYGHIDGVGIYGVGTAARAFFDREVEDLDLAQSATLAGMVQAPNRLSPLRHPEATRSRRDRVLDRLEELGWMPTDDLAIARAAPLVPSPGKLTTTRAPAFLSWLAESIPDRARERVDRDRGIVVETRLDPLLQQHAEHVVGAGLRDLRRRRPALRDAPLSAALVAMDARDGAVLAYVGGSPDRSDNRFDRVRQARRQPGSTVKPFVALHALESCGGRRPLTAATTVLDGSVTLKIDDDAWTPENFDRRDHGPVTLRSALVQSLNVPWVRIARHCGWEKNAHMFARVGLSLPDPTPPSFVLGAVEVSPLELVSAYSVFSTPGRRVVPRGWQRIEQPDGSPLGVNPTRSHAVSSKASAWIVRDLLLNAVREGTARSAQIENIDVAAKTGSSSGLRDAWLAGSSGHLVVVVWVGRDDSGPLGSTASRTAAPIWKAFVEHATRLEATEPISQPRGVVAASIDRRTGLRVDPSRSSARQEWFRRGSEPPKQRFWRRSQSQTPIR